MPKRVVRKNTESYRCSAHEGKCNGSSDVLESAAVFVSLRIYQCFYFVFNNDLCEVQNKIFVVVNIYY